MNSFTASMRRLNFAYGLPSLLASLIVILLAGCGGGTQASVSSPPAAPTLASIAPATAVAGSGAFVLTANGANFTSASTVLWNGATRVTTLVSSTQATAQILAADIATAASASVSVQNSSSSTSGSLPFTITVAPNLAPVLASLAPATATAGSGALTVSVSGSGFTSASIVQVGGSPRATTFVSTTSLTAQLTAADIATAGSLSVSVQTPAPGGGTSGILNFSVTNPVPALASLSPASAPAGSSGVTLNVSGTNFVASSQVLWNDSARTTTFVSSTMLTAQITAADLVAVGSATVTVSNPAPGGGTSTAAPFTIAVPAPTLSGVAPSSVLVGSGAQSLAVSGIYFAANSIVQVNGAARTTAYVSANSLTAQLTAADTASAAVLTITVTTPAPGGGTSSSINFAVNNPVPTVSVISPTSVTRNGNPLTLTVTGTNFVAGAQILWNGVARTTTFVSSTSVFTQVGFADLNASGAVPVAVSNPGPGGGPSGSATFTVAANSATSFTGCTDVDINIGTKPAGSATVNGSSVTVSGSGADINGTSDSFNYCYLPVTGNFQMIARINQPTSPAAINAGAKVGVMVRATTDSNSRHEMIYMNASTAVMSSNRRELTGATAIDRSKTLNPAAVFPYYVRLQRYGDLISLDYSPDGTTYQSILSTQSLVGLAANVDIGFEVTSRTTSLLTATFDNISLTPLAPPAQPVTSWLGNTYGGGGSFMIYRGQGIATDAANNVFVTGQGEEESGDFLDTDGNFISYPYNSHYNTDVGIAWDPRNSYVWMANAPFVSSGGTEKGGINAYAISGVQGPAILQTGTGSNQTAARTINGIAIYNNVLYAIDAANQATPSDTSHVTVHTIDLTSATFAEGTPFLLPAGAMYVAADPAGHLWVVFTGTSNYVEEYSTAGVDLGKHISGLVLPSGIATDASGNIYVTDAAPSVQQILVFDNNGNSLATLGAAGGILSTCNGTVPGQIDPCKLDHPEGIAVDASGNLYVASSGAPTITFGNSGMVLRKYNNVASNLSAGLSSANMAWHREGLDYTDSAAVNLQSEVDIYDKMHHYKMDYSQPAGQGWSLYGTTTDDLHYPADPRLTTRYYAAPWIRTLNGNKFMVVTDENSGRLDFYRFQQGSEIMIPYATFIRETDRGQKDDAATIWIDANLNGIVDAGETQSIAPPPAAPPSAEYLEWYIDSNGDVWTGLGYNTTARVLRYKMTLGANGYPTYSTTNTTSYAPPAFMQTSNTTESLILREVYLPATDTMFLGGYTAAIPKPDSGYPVGALGTQIVRYDNFTTNPTVGCTMALPFYPDLAGQAGTGDAPKAMDVAGNLLAVGDDFSNKITLFNTQGSCPQVAEFTPGPEVGGTEGTIDSENTVMMYYRGASTNEYDIFVEEGGQHKILMYRYIYP